MSRYGVCTVRCAELRLVELNTANILKKEYICWCINFILLHTLSEENHKENHKEFSSFETQLLQDRRLTCNMKLWRVRVIIFVMEEQ